jgi:hypothetical protein
MLEKLRDWLFGCTHPRYSWPQGKGANCHVTCLTCGREFAYDFRAMKVVEPADHCAGRESEVVA